MGSAVLPYVSSRLDAEHAVTTNLKELQELLSLTYLPLSPAAATPPVGEGLPLRMLPVGSVEVEGPEITKVTRSSRS